MSYRCDPCGAAQPPRSPKLVHLVLRPHTGQVAAEVPVCPSCKQRLSSGETLADLRAEREALLHPTYEPLPVLAVAAVESTQDEAPQPRAGILDRMRARANGDLAVRTPRHPTNRRQTKK